MSKESRIFSIYALCDPRPQYQETPYEFYGFKGIRYIGQTFKSIQHRLRGHLLDDSNPYKRNWIKALQREGLMPNIVVLHTNICSQEEADLLEKDLIAEARDRIGKKLLNLSIGGQGVYYSKEQMEESRTRFLKGSDGYERPGNMLSPNLRDAVCTAVRKQMLVSGNRYIKEINYMAKRDSLKQISTIKLGTKAYVQAYHVGLEGGSLPPGKLIVEAGFLHGLLTREGYAKPLDPNLCTIALAFWEDSI